MDINLHYLFEGQPTVTSKIASIQGTGDESIAIRFSRDAEGTITAMALRRK